MRNLQVVALCLSLAKDCESIAISEALAFAATNWQVAPSVAGQFSNPLNNPDPPSDTNKDTTFPTAADNGRVPYLPATSCSQSVRHLSLLFPIDRFSSDKESADVVPQPFETDEC